jgi:hypothetical protein
MSEKPVMFNDEMAEIEKTLVRISVRLGDLTASAVNHVIKLENEIASLKAQIEEKRQPIDDDIK